MKVKKPLRNNNYYLLSISSIFQEMSFTKSKIIKAIMFYKTKFQICTV